MNRKYIPLVLMLLAGAITCIITFFSNYLFYTKLLILFIVLLVFYLLGCILKYTLDYFEKQNNKRLKEMGEVIEKEAVNTEEAGENQKE